MHSIPNLYRELSDKEDSENDGRISVLNENCLRNTLVQMSLNSSSLLFQSTKKTKDNPEWIFEESMDALPDDDNDDDEVNMPWQVKRCMICNNSENFEVVCSECDKLTKHTISNSKWYQCSACGNQEELFSSPSSIMKSSLRLSIPYTNV